MGHGPVVDTLIASGKIDAAQVEGLPADNDKPAEQQLLENGTLTTKDILDALTETYHVPAIILAEEEIDPEAVALVPQDMAMNCRVLPLRREPDKVVLAMVDPTDVVAEDFVRFVTGFDIERVVAMPWELQAEIDKRFKPAAGAQSSEMFSALDELATQQEEKEKLAAQTMGEAEETDAAKEAEASNAAPVVKAVHSLLSEGVLQKASDIHFEPVATGLRVRYRIDGYLREITELPKMVQPMVLSRIKLQSGMDISEKRKPQDGRTRLQVGEREIDFRVSSLPTFYGEKIVMRILDSRKAKVEIEIMGWSDRDLKAFLDFIRQPQGAILITGPTGSGKTSTLYAALSRLHTPDTNIVTVEDPVEFQISGINQVQVNNKAGLTFASALRSILRQDPNIVMLGEIRDSETANIAFEAAMTGHLVLSTLHTNDAPSAVTRLGHIGVPNYMVAASLIGVVAQRLVRKLCKDCKTRGPMTPEIRDILGRSGVKEIPDEMWLPGGCKACGNSGYTGRMGIFEVLRVTEQVKACIYAEASEQEMKEVARGQGMNTLLEDGLRKANEGQTSIEEVLSVAPSGTEAEGDGGDAAPAFAGGGRGGHGGHGGHGRGNGGGQPQPIYVMQMPAGGMPMQPQMIPMPTAMPAGQVPMMAGAATFPISPPSSGGSVSMAGFAGATKGSGSTNSSNDDAAMITCVCGNSVPAEQPYCTLCGNILEVTSKIGKGGADALPIVPNPDYEVVLPATSQPPVSQASSNLGTQPPMTGQMPMGGMMPQMPAAGGQMVPCQCGNYYSMQDRFCNVCGTPSPYAGGGMRPPMGPPAGGVQYCVCGAVHPAHQRFCNVCGATLASPYAARPPYGGQPAMHAPQFPMQGGGYGMAGAPMMYPRTPGRRERILVIDDDPDLLSYVQRVLELEFYEVVLARDGQEGFAMALSVGADLIIADVSMPGMDGVNLCRKLRSHYQTRNVPIIMLTGLVAVEDESRGLEAGADDYLTKPINPARLIARIESHLRRARMGH